MGRWFNRIWSGLDFWDEEENRRQREQFAREDEEEERRRAQEQAVRDSVTQQTQEALELPPPSEPLTKVASQAQFQQEQAEKLEKAQPEIPRYKNLFEAIGDKFEANSPQDQAKRLQKGEPRTYEEQQSGGGAKGFIKRNFLNAKGLANIAKSVGQGVARAPEEILRTTGDVFLTGAEKLGVLNKQDQFYRDMKENLRSQTPTDPIRKFLYGSDPVESYYKTGETLSKAASDYTGKDLSKATPLIGTAFLALDALSGGKASQISKELVEQGTRQAVQKTARNYGVDLADDAADVIASNKNAKQIEGILKKQGKKIPDNTPPPLQKAPSEDAPEIPGQLRKTEVQGQPAVNVDDGVKSTNLAKVREEAENLNIPAYQRIPAKRALANLEEESRENTARQLGVGEQPIDTPAYQHKQSVQDVIDQGDRELNDFIEANPNASRQELEAARQSITDQVSARINQLQAARYGIPAPNIPSVTDPIALAKADGAIPTVTEGAPIANFANAENGSLQKVDTSLPAAPGTRENPIPLQEAPARTAEGNVPLRSEADIMREAMDQGVVPVQGPSVTAITEDAMAEAADRAVREQVDVPAVPESFDPSAYDTLADTAGTGEIGKSKGSYARGQEYEKTSIEAARARGAEGANTMSYEQLINDIQTQGTITGQHVDTARVMQERFPTGSPEHKALGQIVGRQGTQAGQALRLQDQVIRKTATGKQLTDKFANKLYRHMGDDATLTEADFDQLARLSDDFVAARDSKDAAYDAFLNDPSDANVDMVVQSVRRAEEADKAARLGEFQLAENKLGGQRQNQDVQRFLTELEKDAGVYKMSYVDSSMLSSTRVMLNNFLNTFGVGQEEKLFGKVGARLARAFTGESIGGGSRAGRKLGNKIGWQNLSSDYKLRKQGSGNPLVKALQNFTTTGNTLGERNIQGVVYSGMYDHYRQALKKAGFTGDELKRRTLINTLIDPDDVKEAYTTPVLTANALSSLTGPRGKKIETAMKDMLTRKMGGSKAAETASNIIMRVTIGFPTVIGRSFEQGVRRLSLGSVSTAQAVTNAIKGGEKAVTAQHIKNAVKEAGTGATMLGMGAALAQADMISGSWPTDKAEQEAWMREGKTDNSIKLFGNWYNLPAALGGFALPFMMGANLSQMEEDDNALMTAFTTSVDALPIESFANTPNLILDAARGRDVGGKVAQFGSGVVRGLTPLGSLVNQLAKAFDPNANDTKKGDVLAQFMAKIQDGLPGLANTLPDRVVDGNVIENPDPVSRMLGAVSKEQGAGVEQSQRLQGQIDESLNKLNQYGVFTDNIANILDDETKYIFDQARQGKQLDEADKDKLMSAITKGVTDSGETRFLEDGDYDSHLAVLQTKRELLNSDPTTRRDLLDEYDKQITRARVYKENDYPYEVVQAYKEVSLTEWRNMGDPEKEEYDPEMHKLLADIDGKLTKLKAGRGRSGKSKYYAKAGGSGRGGRGRKGPRFLTDIATQSLNNSYQPIALQKATFGTPGSPIPELEKVPNYDQSKLKKITVSKGAR